MHEPSLFRLHKATLLLASRPDPSRRLSQAGPSVPRSTVSTTSRRLAECIAGSVRLHRPRRRLECSRSTSTGLQGAPEATASCPCARQRQCPHWTATPEAQTPGLGVDIEVSGDLVVEVGPVGGPSPDAVEDQRDLNKPWDGWQPSLTSKNGLRWRISSKSHTVLTILLLTNKFHSGHFWDMEMASSSAIANIAHKGDDYAEEDVVRHT